jgi:hypothetical protein
MRARRALQMLGEEKAFHVHVGNEIPGGAIDGANRVFALAHVPVPSSLQLFKNGLFMAQGATDDYTLSGSTVTFTADQVPQAADANGADKLRAFYIKAS